MIETKAPAPYKRVSGHPSIFLAGSIEMGLAEDWQSCVKNLLKDYEVHLLNPRRDDWDSSWVQSIHNKQFREQVEWELGCLAFADAILLYLAPGTKSPISLLELGLYATSGKLFVCCSPDFWRRGNVEIVCERFKIPLFESLDYMAIKVVGTLLERSSREEAIMINGQKVLTEADLATIEVDLERGVDDNDILKEMSDLIFTVRALREMLRQIDRARLHRGHPRFPCSICHEFNHTPDCEWVAVMGEEVKK